MCQCRYKCTNCYSAVLIIKLICFVSILLSVDKEMIVYLKRTKGLGLFMTSLKVAVRTSKELLKPPRTSTQELVRGQTQTDVKSNFTLSWRQIYRLDLMESVHKLYIFQICV